MAKWWYWNLKGNQAVETTAGPYPNNVDRWQAFPLIFDDGKDEFVTWRRA